MVVPKPMKKGLYRHFKGGMYEVVDTVIDSESLETMVLYRPIGTAYLWVRPYTMFCESVESEGVVKPRFSFISEHTKT
ncbi:MAG: DUF1653 domain-containing protein [Sphaerochaeta sp.]|jgi:hypothetical protein|uniref:DUF1653 domain-containing protein n=1 Tax=Sphaerochaeta sp. TaxID=1972642 RepID=UPI002FCA24FA